MFEKIQVPYDESFEMDTQYFIMRVTKNGLRAERYTEDNQPTHVLTAYHLPKEQQAEALRKYINANFAPFADGHMGYIGQELGRAESAMMLGVEYTQDTPVTGE